MQQRRHQAVHFRPQHARLRDQPADAARRERTTRKAVQKDLGAGRVAAHQKEVDLGNILINAFAESQAVQLFKASADGVRPGRRRQFIRVSNARVVIQQLAAVV